MTAPILGQQVMLRPFRLADAEPLWEAMSVEAFTRLTGTHGSFTPEQINAYVARQVEADYQTRAPFIIAPADDSQAVGEVILMDISAPNRSAWLRIALFGEQHLGKGYGTEAMRLILAYGFEQLALHRIALEVYAFNPRAQHVYEKVGFRREGTLRDALLWEGAWVDAIIMSILEDEWRAAATR